MEIGTARGGEMSSAEIAGRLGMSRESIHQLLLPLVRAGLVTAARGRTGGYRAAESLPSTPVATVVAPFEAAAPGPKALPASPVDAVEAEAEAARRAVLERVTVGDLLARVRAERGALDWEI